MTEHYMVETTTPRWLSTALTTLGAALIASLLVWIATSQLKINTQMAVVLYKLEAQEASLDSVTNDIDGQIQILLDNQNRIWPRLRGHGENIAILRQEIERLCDCKIQLQEPEPF